MTRFFYFFSIIITIGLGILSRHINGIPLFIGDILWGLMTYLIARFIFVKRPVSLAAIVSLVFCYAIEFSQLYQAPWLNSIRHTILGGLILGEVFLWGDMLCYTAGVAFGAGIDLLFQKRRSSYAK